ncbi:MAG: SpoIIE family protein phosphatase [Pirellulales bacterium]|nr:SpoIIE family protein phosphatase [Pirellulales bacterium]
MAYLEVGAGRNIGQRIALDGDSFVLGRHPNCDIVLDEGAVSRQHAKISRQNGKFIVEDLGSRNGTFVNNEEVLEPQPLTAFDEVKICDLVFTFNDAAPSQPDTLTKDGATIAMMVEEHVGGNSTIMSQLDLSSLGGTLRVSVNPEVKLKALIEITKDLANLLTLEEMLPKILDSLFKIFVQADRGFIVLRDAPDGPLIPKAVRNRRDKDEDAIRISKTVVRRVMDEKQAILSADAAADSKFAMSESIADFHIRSLMCVPIIGSDGEAIGVIQIDTLDQRSRFQDEDLEVLASVGSQAAFAIENARLHASMIQQAEFERDLAMAREVQQGMLPHAAPRIESYSFFHFYEPAKDVGGDLYDYVVLPDSRVAILLGDVSGKGISAAILMAKITSEARFHLASGLSAGQTMTSLSTSFAGRGWDDRFVTMVLAVVNTNTHEVTLVNAGHMPPLLRDRKGVVTEVGEESASVPLGVLRNHEYEEFTLMLEPGSNLTAYTDGFSEALNSTKQLYGIKRLEEQLSRTAASVSEMGEHLLKDVTEFVGDTPQSDDMCLICFGRDPEVVLRDTDPSEVD